MFLRGGKNVQHIWRDMIWHDVLVRNAERKHYFFVCLQENLPGHI